MEELSGLGVLLLRVLRWLRELRWLRVLLLLLMLLLLLVVSLLLGWLLELPSPALRVQRHPSLSSVLSIPTEPGRLIVEHARHGSCPRLCERDVLGRERCSSSSRSVVPVLREVVLGLRWWAGELRSFLRVCLTCVRPRVVAGRGTSVVPHSDLLLSLVSVSLLRRTAPSLVASHVLRPSIIARQDVLRSPLPLCINGAGRGRGGRVCLTRLAYPRRHLCSSVGPSDTIPSIRRVGEALGVRGNGGSACWERSCRVVFGCRPAGDGLASGVRSRLYTPAVHGRC
jgi:hypothetical protein